MDDGLGDRGSTATRTRKKSRGATPKSGFWAAKEALRRFGESAIDGRTSLAKALDETRRELVASLGGPDALSKQQEVLVGIVVRSYFLLESLDAYILRMDSPVNRRKRCVYPVIRERAQLADSLLRHLTALGLERKPRPVKSLSEYLAAKEAGKASPGAPEPRRAPSDDEPEPAEVDRDAEPPETPSEEERE
jgi:hypothetical protein